MKIATLQTLTTASLHCCILLSASAVILELWPRCRGAVGGLWAFPRAVGQQPHRRGKSEIGRAFRAIFDQSFQTEELFAQSRHRAAEGAPLLRGG